LCFCYLCFQFVRVLEVKNLCFVFWLPPFSIYESAGGKNLCFVFLLPLFSICESQNTKQRFFTSNTLTN
jgi:hypothetical protein